MRTTVGAYGSPEFMLHCMGMAELAHHYYRLPVWGFSGCSDSKVPDIQAGIESALWILLTAFSGANLVHDVGYIESAMTCSYEMVVICDEIISFVRRLMGGIPVTAETLALPVIDTVGPGGTFLNTRHTLNHYREVWYPRLFDRQMHGAWQKKGRPTALENAREIAREAIRSHQPAPLANGVGQQLQAIIDEADTRFGSAASR